MHCRRKAVRRLIPHPDGVLLGGKFGNRTNRSEDLFLHDLHILADVAEDGRLDEVALFAMALAADFNFGSCIFSCADIAEG